MRTTLTALIHGESGVGKSWLADTVPGPRLILDAEGRAKYTPSGPKVSWDPKTGPPPDMTPYPNGSCVVPITDFDTLMTAYTWLRAGQHNFNSIVIDSLMEAQKRCIDGISGVLAMQTQDWGTLLRNLEGLVRQYRDLTMLPDATQTASTVVFVCGSRMVKDKMKPLLQGQFMETVPYYLDVVGYLYKQPVTSADGASTIYQRQLLIEAQPQFEAKDNTGRLVKALGPVVPIKSEVQAGFDIADLVGLLNGKPESVAQEGVAV